MRHDTDNWNALIEARPDARGFVVFPAPDSDKTGENGLDVYLVVVDERDHTTDESWIRTSWTLCNTSNIGMDKSTLMGDQTDTFEVADKKYFPFEGEDEYRSVSLLFAAHIGTTKHAFLRNGDYWRCTEADLTDHGDAMLTLVKRLYPGKPWALLTFLDT